MLRRLLLFPKVRLMVKKKMQKQHLQSGPYVAQICVLVPFLFLLLGFLLASVSLALSCRIQRGACVPQMCGLVPFFVSSSWFLARFGFSGIGLPHSEWPMC